MKNFAYVSAGDFDAAAKALAAAGEGAVAKAAGTDLLDLMKERVVAPGEVHNLLRVQRGEKKGEISALATLREVAEDEWVRLDFPALHTAAAEAATPQVRNVGTLGGNLAQHTRCWYFRNDGYDCLKRGGGGCAAQGERAENRYHGIFPQGGCAAAHSSNLAPALIAVGAQVVCVHPDGDRVLDAGLLYEAPRKGVLGDTTLRPGELIRAVRLTPSPLARNSVYVELRERQSFDFALASVAAAVHVDGDAVRDARIVCGAVAPVPYRAEAAEKALVGKKFDADAIAQAARAVVAGAAPLAQNAYKARILERLAVQALEELR